MKDNEKAFAAWQATMEKRAAQAKDKAVDWRKVKLDPSQLVAEMGPVLTEEQFKEYCRKTGMNHPVLKIEKK